VTARGPPWVRMARRVPIVPLPIFEQEADPATRGGTRTDEQIYAARKPPTSIVVRYGARRMVGEFPYDGSAKPGCGSRIVVRTPRGTELGEMLTTTCGNGGCGKSVSRSEMLQYIERSGGKDYPFSGEGRVLRVAEPADMETWSQLQASTRARLDRAREIARDFALPIKLVELEAILGGELLTLHWMALDESRPDVGPLVAALQQAFGTPVTAQQIGARDEARLVADYEKCGQHCCCKNFLKVLKPVSMKSAKTQKATMDPLKISGRCGRLMCCLRYEDQTYEELARRLPKKGTRVNTGEGPGSVIDGRILVQLVLVRLDADRREIAVPVEELLP
jgi:cell fate regulator YaaT (PSP1 superfamily)